jgi:hypothetical protein
MTPSLSANDTVYIYGLYDQREPEHIRYVGKTNRLKRRMVEHVHHSINNKTYKDKWIKKLIADGQNPMMIILEQTNYLNWSGKEKEWIKTLKIDGHRLTNLTDGGEGNNYVRSEELKKKLSDFRKKNPVILTSEGYKRKMDYLRNRRQSESTKKKISDSNKKSKTKYQFNDEWLTIREASIKFNINYSTLKNRIINIKLTADQSILSHIEVDKINDKKFNFNNELLTLKEAAEKFQISYSKLRYRINKKKLTPNEAILSTKDLRKLYPRNNTEKYFFTENDYLTIRQAAYKYNIEYSCLLYRIKKMKIDPQESILGNDEFKKHIKHGKHNFNGEMLTIKEAGIKYKIHVSTLQNRLKTMSAEEAITLSSFDLMSRKKSKLFLIHNEYFTLTEISKKYNINRSTIKSRLFNGLSIVQAINKTS